MPVERHFYCEKFDYAKAAVPSFLEAVVQDHPFLKVSQENTAGKVLLSFF